MLRSHGEFVLETEVWASWWEIFGCWDHASTRRYSNVTLAKTVKRLNDSSFFSIAPKPYRQLDKYRNVATRREPQPIQNPLKIASMTKRTHYLMLTYHYEKEIETPAIISSGTINMHQG